MHVSSPGRTSRWRSTTPRRPKYATFNARLRRSLTFCSPRSASTSDGSLGLLATQTLTFLFTDIEGSTALLARLGDGYAQVLADHHRLIRASLAAHGGEEVDTQGDAFFAVFSSPSACIAAAIEMQRAFLSYSWPAGGRVRVRMGVHSGEASQTEAGLVGLSVHRAARVAAVGHGGQTLVSAATAALLGDSMPVGASLKDLGLHRLKDLGRPGQIFQLGADGLVTAFPPLRSLDNPKLRNNLPVQVSSFIGRDAELSEVGRLIAASRLLTLTGSGWRGQDPVPLEYSIDWLTCAIASRLGAVMVGWPGAAQDRLLAGAPGTRLGCPYLPRGRGEGS